jgi:hypothetical protein
VQKAGEVVLALVPSKMRPRATRPERGVNLVDLEPSALASGDGSVAKEGRELDGVLKDQTKDDSIEVPEILGQGFCHVRRDPSGSTIRRTLARAAQHALGLVDADVFPHPRLQEEVAIAPGTAPELEHPLPRERRAKRFSRERRHGDEGIVEGVVVVRPEIVGVARALEAARTIIETVHDVEGLLSLA